MEGKNEGKRERKENERRMEGGKKEERNKSSIR